MKENVMLTIASLLSILLLTLHITDDIVRGISKAEPSNIALAVLVVLLYGTLVLAERRSGYVIMLLVGLFAAAMPVMHMRGAHYGEIAKSTGASSSSGHSGRSAGSGASPSSSRRADCGVCDGASHGSPTTRTWKGSIWRLSATCGPDDGQPFHNPVREGLPTIRTKAADQSATAFPSPSSLRCLPPFRTM